MKPSALVLELVGKGKKSPDAEEPAESEESIGSLGSMSAARDILAAIKANDATALNEALKAHRECCADDEGM